MKYHKLYILSCISSFLLAQSSQQLIGTLAFPDKNIITYKLDFAYNDEFQLNGKSITDFDGLHRTVTNIKGSINPTSNRISFSETHNLSTKSKLPQETFCYVHVKNAKIKLRGGKSIIQGSFLGKDIQGKLCAKGDLYLIGQQQFISKMKKVHQKLTQSKKASTALKKQTSPNQIQKVLNTNKLHRNEQLFVETTAKVATLYIRDTEIIDGDKISISFNGEPLLNEYTIQAEPKQITLTLQKGVNLIAIQALNTGSKPPNSTNIALVVGKVRHLVTTKLEENETTYIKIKS